MPSAEEGSIPEGSICNATPQILAKALNPLHLRVHPTQTRCWRCARICEYVLTFEQGLFFKIVLNNQMALTMRLFIDVSETHAPLRHKNLFHLSSAIRLQTRKLETHISLETYPC